MVQQRFYGIKSCINAKCLRCRIAGVFDDRRGNSSRFLESCARAERNSLRYETTGKYTDGSNFESTRSYTLFLLKLKLDVSINYYETHSFCEFFSLSLSLFSLSYSLSFFLSLDCNSS